jgi:hypothetical protein
LTPYLTKFEIPVALEAFIASKEVLVRRPAPPGIRPFLEINGQYITYTYDTLASSIILFDFLLHTIYLDTLCLIYEIILLIIIYPYSNILHTKASEFTDPP